MPHVVCRVKNSSRFRDVTIFEYASLTGSASLAFDTSWSATSEM